MCFLVPLSDFLLVPLLAFPRRCLWPWCAPQLGKTIIPRIEGINCGSPSQDIPQHCIISRFLLPNFVLLFGHRGFWLGNWSLSSSLGSWHCSLRGCLWRGNWHSRLGWWGWRGRSLGNCGTCDTGTTSVRTARLTFTNLLFLPSLGLGSLGYPPFWSFLSSLVVFLDLIVKAPPWSAVFPLSDRLSSSWPSVLAKESWRFIVLSFGSERELDFVELALVETGSVGVVLISSADPFPFLFFSGGVTSSGFLRDFLGTRIWLSSSGSSVKSDADEPACRQSKALASLDTKWTTDKWSHIINISLISWNILFFEFAPSVWLRQQKKKTNHNSSLAHTHREFWFLIWQHTQRRLFWTVVAFPQALGLVLYSWLELIEAWLQPMLLRPVPLRKYLASFPTSTAPANTTLSPVPK